jgi:hypothetical protein
MKKDVFEKLVSDHRDDFDSRTPSDKVWTRISSAVFEGTQASVWNSVGLWRAAAILLMGFSAFLFFNRHTVLPAKSMASQEFTDVESYYSAQIVEKAALISNEGLFVDDSFTQDLQKLEAMYSVMAEEMKKHPSEKVKDALVLNMLVRIDLMNQQIQKLEESKQRKKVEAII